MVQPRPCPWVRHIPPPGKAHSCPSSEETAQLAPVPVWRHAQPRISCLRLPQVDTAASHRCAGSLTDRSRGPRCRRHAWRCRAPPHVHHDGRQHRRCSQRGQRRSHGLHHLPGRRQLRGAQPERRQDEAGCHVQAQNPGAAPLRREHKRQLDQAGPVQADRLGQRPADFDRYDRGSQPDDRQPPRTTRSTCVPGPRRSSARRLDHQQQDSGQLQRGRDPAQPLPRRDGDGSAS